MLRVSLESEALYQFAQSVRQCVGACCANCFDPKLFLGPLNPMHWECESEQIR